MKFQSEDLRKLDEALHFVLDVSGNHVSDVTTTSQAWQVFHAAMDYGKIDVQELYKRYNDNHIETAMLSIFTNCKRKR